MHSITHRREKVLVVAHSDNFIEVFGPKNVTVLIARCPTTGGLDGEELAEDYLESSLPPRWQELYFPGYLRASLANRPLVPSVMDESQWTRDFLTGINNMSSQQAPSREVMVWT